MENKKNINQEQQKNLSLQNNLLKAGLLLGVIIVLGYLFLGFLEGFETLKFKPKKAFKNSLEGATYFVLGAVFMPVIILMEQRLGILKVVLEFVLSVFRLRFGGGGNAKK
ncbi:hypothetical protein [uncultured Microscilla sp.]|uniref:hypothetical protein n=1 Tax=uncultured Microscilla sp. TaxID=432653 RepID=UPI002624B27F|nr:hypothetical protein [uncultured Microscilla sp.]